MSELLINAVPTQAPTGAGNANALSQSDAATRTGESTRANTESGTESPFAAVLKSRMDKKAASTDEADSASSAVVAPQTDAQYAAINVDLSVLLPLLVGNQAVAASADTTSAAATRSDSDQKLIAGLQAPTEQAPAQFLAALPAAPVGPSAAPPVGPAAALPAAPVGPSATPPVGPAVAPLAAPVGPAAAPPVGSSAALPVGVAAAVPSAPTAAPPAAFALVADTSPSKQSTDTKEEAFASAVPARSGEMGETRGKIAPAAAINADAGLKTGEKNTPEPSANDFHALLDRATAMTPTATSLASNSSSNPSLRIDTPLGQTGWHDEVGQKLTWMVGNNRQQADLVLNPPQLGRVEVSLTMNGDQATAIFTSSNPAVREALENSLHRLREVLADAGVSLGQTQVGSESPNQPARKDTPDLIRSEAIGYASTIPLPGVALTARTSAGSSMIDIFA